MKEEYEDEAYENTPIGMAEEMQREAVEESGGQPMDDEELQSIIASEIEDEKGVNVTVQQYDASVYTLTADAERLPAPATNLPNPFSVQPPPNQTTESVATFVS